MRHIIILFAILCAPASMKSQGAWGGSAGFSAGLIKSDGLSSRGFGPRIFSYGGSFGIDVIKGVAFSLRYDVLTAKDKIRMDGGHVRHLQLNQNLGKFMIGYGMCDPEGGMFAVQFGFTIGHETAKFYHEYPDGTISYGMDDPGNGVFESFRALPPLLAMSGGYAISEGWIAFIHIERDFKKGFGESPFQDWHFQKDMLFGVSSGGSSSASYITNDVRAWRCEIGMKYMLGF